MVRWPLQPLQPFQKTQLQPPFGPSVDLLCHPWFSTTNLSYRFPAFDISAAALRGTAGIYTSSTAQGGGGSFKNRKPIGEVGCCESRMAERSHWLIERCLISLTLSLSLFSAYLPTYLSIFYVSIQLSIYLSIYLSLSLSLSLSSVYLSSCLPVYLSVYLSIYLFVCLSICLPVYLWCSVIQSNVV